MAKKGFDMSGVGSMLSGASSLIGAFAGLGSGHRQKELMDYQYMKEEEYQKKMSQHNWAKYNSPGAQRRAMEAAGINPFVGDSSIGGMQMDSNASGPDLQDAANPLGDFASNIQAGASSLFQMAETKRVNDSIIEKNESDALKARADAGDIGATQPGRVEGLGLDNQRKRTDNVYQEQFLQTELGQKIQSLENSRQELSNLVKSGKLTDAQVETTKKQLEIMDGQIALLREQVQTEGSKRENLRAQTELTDAQRETEDKLRDGRVSLTSSQVQSVLRDIGLKDLQQTREYFELAQALQGIRNATSVWSLVDQMTKMKTYRDDGRLKPSSNELYKKMLDKIDYILRTSSK